ncbi:MAG: hypothetical protein RIT81_30395 [Deltaproteobacteria bacterium]
MNRTSHLPMIRPPFALMDPTLFVELVAARRESFAAARSRDTFVRGPKSPYVGTAPRLSAAQVARIETGRVIERSAGEMARMYRNHGALLPAGRYYEKLFDHGTGAKSPPVGPSGKVLVRMSTFPRPSTPAHRDVAVDIVDTTVLDQLGVAHPTDRAEVAALKARYPQAVKTVHTKTEADVFVDLPPGHRFLMMGPPRTMGMLANAEIVTTDDGTSW